jgi:excisionase family DNA binding protein
VSTDLKEIIEKELPPRPFFFVKEAAEATNFSPDFIADAIRCGELSALQATPGVSGSRFRIPRGSLVAWLASMAVGRV